MTLNNIMQAIIARKRKRGAIRIPVAPRGDFMAPDKPIGDRVVRVLDEADIRPVPAMDNRLLDHLLRRAPGDQMSPWWSSRMRSVPQGGEVKVMQHHADVQLPAGGEPFEQTQQVLLIVKVQRRGGLIEKQPALRRAVAP